MKHLVILLFVPAAVFSQRFTANEINRYEAQAKRVTIIRDNWGIAHVYGKSDADAVFGLLYAQCEENFYKVEENNLEMLGRLSEKYGIEKLYDDLMMRLIYDSSAAIADYRKSPQWFKKLLDAAADGVNYFIYKHPETRPAVLIRFEPWFALMRTNGSISATQTAGITIADLRNLYGVTKEHSSKKQSGRICDPTTVGKQETSGSNGFALAPSRTKSKNAIIYINPHVTFYYRTEMQMVSDEGLNAYGGVTWGTFFVFQGFNEHCGWMHTSSDADVADAYLEKIEKKGKNFFYLYNKKTVPVKIKRIVVGYKDGHIRREETFTTYATVHGPVIGRENGDWLSLKENNRSLTALMQSWLRTKAKDFADFKRIMNMRSNSSDNTVFADYQGNIAYWHGNFIPRRNPELNWEQPVDGTTSVNEWKGLHTLDEMVHVYNPATGWIQNCNSTPFTVSGSSSPKKEKYPFYMAPDPENYRGINAARILSKAMDMTIDRVITEVGYSHYLAAFEDLLAPLFKTYDEVSSGDSLKQSVSEAMSILRDWDRNSSVSSVATTLAIEWADYRKNASTAKEELQAFSQVLKNLEKRFGSWKVPWGEVNRYERVAEGEKFEDNAQSLPSGLASSRYGSLPSFVSRQYPNTNRRYGYNGNSFVACVEFGAKVKAKSIVTGGQSFDPSSKHFTDQAQMFLDGNFKDVLFYKEDVLKHVERKYHPGE